MSRLKMLIAALATSLAFLVTGCVGQFALSRKVYAWNTGITNSKVVNSLVFFAFLVIPVYELTFLGDWLIFNTVEAIDGTNPISLEDGILRIQRDGHEYVVRQVGPAAIELERDGVILGGAEQTADGTLVAHDASGKQIASLPAAIDNPVSIVR